MLREDRMLLKMVSVDNLSVYGIASNSKKYCIQKIQNTLFAEE